MYYLCIVCRVCVYGLCAKSVDKTLSPILNPLRNNGAVSAFCGIRTILRPSLQKYATALQRVSTIETTGSSSRVMARY